VVVDAGTLEHVFHLPNVLRNIGFFLRPGGRIIHVSPACNHVDHGLYMFSPTLFWSYYSTNGFGIEKIQLIRHSRRPEVDPWFGRDYTPGSLDHVSYGGLDDSLYSVLCVATKPESGATSDIPQQHFYVHQGWKTEDGTEIVSPAMPRGWRKLLKDRLPAVYRFAKSCRDRPKERWAKRHKPKLDWPYRY